MSKCVLVTRPGEDGVALAEILKSRGLETVVEPLLSIKLLDGEPLDLSDTQALLLTSANGVRALAGRTERRDLPVFAVGDATATTAREQGFSQVHSAAGNVETLAHLVIEMLNPQDGPLLHVAGSNVAGDLVGIIEAAGFSCTREVLYEAIAERSLMLSTIAAMKDNKIDLVTLYSPRSAELLVDLIRKARLVRSCQTIIVVCLSEAVADKVKELNWQEVKIAVEPNQEALLHLVDELTENNDSNVPTSESKENMSEEKNSNIEDKSEINSLAHRVAPIQRRQGGTARTVFITLLVTAVLVGAGMASKPLWFPKIQEMAPALFAADETDIKITNLDGRLKALEENNQVPDLEALEEERERLQTKLDVTLGRLEKLEESIGTVKKMIDAVNTDPGTGAAQTLQQLSSRLEKLENESSAIKSKDGKTLDGLADEVAALAKKVPTVMSDSQSSEARALVLSIGQLRDAVRSGRAFQDELTALTALVARNENINSALADVMTRLNSIAASGAPNLETLRSQFEQQAGKIVQAGLVPSDGSWFQQTIARLTESVKWRQTDNLVGDGVEAVVARAERALTARDVAKTIKELSNLPEKSAEIAKDWMSNARIYLVAEKALAELQTRAVAQMAAGQ